MKRLLSFILALALLLSLFSCKAYADEAEPPANSGGPSQTLTPDEGISAQEPEESEDLEESEEPEEPEEPEESKGPEEPEDLEEPEESNGFREDLFSDVKQGDWFYEHVKNAYELGVMTGQGDGVFLPLGIVNLAEAVAMAARLRSSYTGDDRVFSGGKPWFAPAVDYAIAQGIIQEGDFASYYAPATRAQFAYILSRALPSGALEERNTVEDNSLPDVRMSDPYAANIYLLYRAGILSGKDARGSFSPSGTLTRAEAAGITSRIASAPLRVECTFYAPAYPDLSLRARADDSFFADTAILGNSLIDGLRLYSKLKTVDFYCGTSMSVYSAMNSRNVLLGNGVYGTQLDAMARKQYGKVYIELGINEIGGSVDSFIKLYGAMLDKIKSAQPNADIYIMAITPTSRAKIGTSFSRDRVIMYNAALYKLAAERECYYLDDFTPLADSEGYLPNTHTWDGVHFTVAKYSDWENIIRTYYA